MAKVTEIPAKKQIGSLAQKKEVRKLRVAAYCRVSTDYEEQASSYQTQIEHYTDVIEKNPDWILAGIFADDGISATSTKNREQFNEMIQACKDGKIDMIITKSISRFARNTVDCQYNGRQGRSPYNHYGFPRPARIRIAQSECKTRYQVPFSTG